VFKQIITECFPNLKNEDPNVAKYKMGLIWAVFSSKRVRFKHTNIFLSWREISTQLAELYNEWYNCSFTTDAFLRTEDPDKTVGEDSEYDDILMTIYRHRMCIGIFKVKSGHPIRTSDSVGHFCEINIITGQEYYYTQKYNKGHCVGVPKRISTTEYEKISLNV